MARICYLHIGPHKTASTTIQNTLLANAALLAGNGLYIPEMQNAKRGGMHQRLAGELNHGRPGNSAEQIANELRSASCPGRILLSSEGFSSRIHEPTARDAIAGFFGELGYRICLIAFIRPQITLVNSLYTEYAKKLIHHLTFDGFFEEFLSNPLSDFNLRFGPAIEDARFDTRFIPFNSATIEAGPSQTLLNSIGVEPGVVRACQISPARNSSPGAKTIAALLNVGERLRPVATGLGKRRLVDFAAALRRLAAARQWNEKSFNGLSSSHVERLRQRFGVSNEQFAERAWKRSWESLFGEDERRAAGHPRCVFDPVAMAPAERQDFDEFCDMAVALLREAGAPQKSPHESAPAAGAAGRSHRPEPR
jgi:hypothetical protein